MPELLFKLRNVPDDEAEEVRQLLNDHEISFYETHAGSWGVSLPGMWLQDDSQLKEAKSLIETYQRERASVARESYEQLKKEGRHETVMDKIVAQHCAF